MRWFTNIIRIAGTNPLEAMQSMEGPEERTFAAVPPVRTSPVGKGLTDPSWHMNSDGAKYGVAKRGMQNVTSEVGAYNIGKKLAPGIIPKTVARMHNGEPHSIQEVVSGQHPHMNPDYMKDDSFSKMTGLHYLLGDDDHMYGANQVVQPDGSVKAIDHGGTFGYDAFMPEKLEMQADGTTKDSFSDMFGASPKKHWSNFQAARGNNIPADFRTNVLNANPQEMADIMRAHGVTWDKTHNHFQQRLKNLQTHFANPEVRTMDDLGRKLHSNWDVT